MFERRRDARPWTDERPLLAMWVLPALTAVGAMAAAFVLVSVALFVAEPVVLGSVWTRLLALAVMLVLPHLATGLWEGYRRGIGAAQPVAAGVAPVLVLLLALLAFGGPTSTPFESPLLTVAAVAVWTATYGGGMIVGATVVRSRRDDGRAVA